MLNKYNLKIKKINKEDSGETSYDIFINGRDFNNVKAIHNKCNCKKCPNKFISRCPYYLDPEKNFTIKNDCIYRYFSIINRVFPGIYIFIPVCELIVFLQYFSIIGSIFADLLLSAILVLLFWLYAHISVYAKRRLLYSSLLKKEKRENILKSNRSELFKNSEPRSKE